MGARACQEKSLEGQPAKLQADASADAIVSAIPLSKEESPEADEAPQCDQEEDNDSKQDQTFLGYPDLDFQPSVGDELSQLSLPTEWMDWIGLP